MAIYKETYEDACQVIREGWEERKSRPNLFSRVKIKFGEKYMIDYVENNIRPGIDVIENLIDNVDEIIGRESSISDENQSSDEDNLFTPQKYKEQDDDRWFSDFEELPVIDKLIEANNLDSALKTCKKGLKKYPDSFLFYMRAGNIFTKLNETEQAKNILLEGLEKSRSKCNLATQLGDIAMEENEPRNTLKWWIASCVMQLEANSLLDAMPFMNISYICKPLGLSQESEWFQEMANLAISMPIQFNGEGATLRYQIAEGLIASGLDDVQSAIRTVYTEYKKKDFQSRDSIEEENEIDYTDSHSSSAKKWWQFWK